jgi:hypothetical protein
MYSQILVFMVINCCKYAMNKIKNPFSPGAGSPPPELVGRDALLRPATVLLGRIKQGRSAFFTHQ